MADALREELSLTAQKILAVQSDNARLRAEIDALKRACEDAEMVGVEKGRAESRAEIERLRAAARKASNALFNLRQIYNFSEHDESVQRVIAELDAAIKDAPVRKQSLPTDLAAAGFAPGNYAGKCMTCAQKFVGDKRAWRCEPCARAALKETSDGTNE